MDALLMFKQEIDDNGYIKEHAARLRKNDGTLLDCLISANSHKDKDGAVIGYQAIIRDITEKKRLETQIHRAQKMDSIGTLASGITHDFNNLLMGMRGKVSLMLFKIDSNHPHYEKLKSIELLIDSATDLTKQLLEFARGGQFVMKTADVNEIIKTSSNMFGRTKKAINIHKKYQKDAWFVNVDQGQIEQVLLNMYVNAAQAMPTGGDIYISSENVILDENFVKPFQIKHGKYVKISIQDNGIGMDEKVMQKIFDPFFTTKKAEKGSGLGLSMAYGIIKKHGGIIDVSSEKGKGSTFDIYLKVSEKPIKKEKKISQSVLTGNESILVIDDEEVIVEHIKEMLETLGYKVFSSLKGKDALEIYKNNFKDIHLVILDMIMPEMNGSEVYQHLKEINPKVKILLASGYTADDKVLEILTNERCGFIQKPFDIVHLSHKVRDVLDSPEK
jgi:signal transduction histidine kinase/CheY-like chemotaxis protein